MASVQVLTTSPEPYATPKLQAERTTSLDVPKLARLYSGNLDSIDEDVPDNPGSAVAARSAAADPSEEQRRKRALEYVRKSWQYQGTGAVKAAAVLSELRVKRMERGGPEAVKSEGAAFIIKHSLDDTFYVYNLGNVTRLFKAWTSALPKVTPYYAVKCNPEPAIVKLLNALGAGFDCASKAELDMVLKLGVPTSRIIFAHPCKRVADLHYAAEHGIEYTTFDTESELHKIKNVYPAIKCVLRLRCDDPEARVPLGLKYGANQEDAEKLLMSAKHLGLSVVGVSFHVGSACKNLAAYELAIEAARRTFDIGERLGFTMDFLDVGGGFTGQFDAHGNVMFGDIALTINRAVQQHFPAGSGVRVIAEPGRFFAETSGTLFTPVYGTRDRPAANGTVHKDYWLTDGLYGSFNCILYDDQKLQYNVLRSPLLSADVDEDTTFSSTLWGPTCDSADVVYKDIALPQLRNGDWLVFPNAGAYTVAGACNFNGINMTQPTTFYVFSDSAVDEEGEEKEPQAEQDAAATN